MEPEEGRKEDQADSAGNEGLNQEATVEQNNKGAAALEGQDQDIWGDVGELNQGRVDMSEGEAALGNYTEAVTETGRKSSLGELKSKTEEEESEELGGADQKDTGLFVSPSAGEEEKTSRGIDQWKIKEHEEERIVEESRFFLEKGEKVVLANQDQRKKEVHADIEEKEKNMKETADRDSMALETAEVLALDQKDSEGETEEVVETTEMQKDNDLSRFGQGSNLEITKEGKEVAADVTSVRQRETEESVGLGREQNKVYTKAGGEEIAGVDQRERESLIAHETEETSVETQGKPEEVLENLREAGEMTPVRDATMAEEEARLLEANQIQVEEAGKAPETEVDQVEAEIGTEKKEASATTLHQGVTEKLVEGSQGESREPVGEQKGAVTLTVAEAEYLQESSEMVTGGEDKIGKVTTEVVMIPVEDNIEDSVETSEVVRGEKDLAAMEAEIGAVGKVTTEDDISLAVANVKVENLMDINEIQMGEKDMALSVEAKEETVELIAEEGGGGEVTEAPEGISRIQEETPRIVMEEIPGQTQDSRSKEKMESEMIEEKVGDLTQPEERLEELVEEKEEEQLASAGMIDKVETEKLEMALAINQDEITEGLRPSQEKAEIAVIDAVREKLPSQEKILSWSPELEGRTQERGEVGSREGISRSYTQEGKLSQELVAELVRIGQEKRDLTLSQVALLETSVRLTEELGKLAREEESQKVKGKIIIGLAGLRQGPIQVTPRRTVRSAGGYNGVLAHVAPGLIVTGLRKPEEKRPIKQDHMELSKRRLEQRETRSAEQGRFGVTTRSNEAVVFMGYRIGRERMYCLSEAEKRMVKMQQLPDLEEIKKKPAVEQVEVARQEPKVKKDEAQEINASEVARHHLEDLPEAWLGRPWTQDYIAAQESSGWTAGVGPGHGRMSRSLRAGIKERINLMVMGERATKSAAQRLEPLNTGIRRRMFELASKSANVHWLNEILRPRPPGSRFGVADQKVHDEGSPGLMAERQSPGLFTRKKELKDWRDGVMGIAIRRYNAMRLAMWGEGPVGLHIKGRKLAEDSYVPTSSSHKVTSILGHVERRVLTMAQQVTNERVPGLQVGGQSLIEALKQDMELARSKKSERFSRSSLPLESETLEVQSEKQVEFSAQTANSESGSPGRRLGCQGTQELDGSSQWLAEQNEASSQHALEQEASTTTAAETVGTRGKEQERTKMQTSPPPQQHHHHHLLHAQATSDKMTGSNPVSPASSGSPSSSGSISPPHLAHDSSLDSHLSFDGPKSQNRALVSSGMYISPDPASMWDKTHAEIAEQAKHEAEIENRIAEMKKEGFWSLKRLSKVPEPIRPKVHWDYLCEEMQWLSADFAQERRWKRGVARKVVRMVIRHHEEQKQKEERAKREEQAKLRRIASSIAKEVKQFWSNVEKVVQFKQQSRLEEKRKKALDLQLDFIVGQTEKYSDLLTQSLNETLPVPSKTSGSHAGSTASSPTPPAQLIEDDGDFQPHEESDDEETIEAEEQQEGNDSETQLREIELLKQESELPLEQLLQTLPSQILENSLSVSPCASSSDDDDDEEEGDSEEEVEQEESQISETLKQEKTKPVTQRSKKPWKPDEEDEEFTANEEEAEDVEETIDAEEKLEGNVDHSKELDDLAKEGELPMEELLQKYAGAYASDFEVEASDTSSEALEPSTSEYEEESEEENSTSHSDSTEEIEESEQEESEVEDALEEERRGASVIQEEDFGVEYLLKQDDDNGGEGDNDSAPAPGPKKEITDIAAAAESLQPKGYTLATTQVKTPIPYLLRGTLREYQHIGLDWLVTMYEKKLNGILADEMGLGKTIQTISLLAHLACEKGSWGPHLIIVPTSVMLNWEMEIKRWCPSFKILTYYGAQKERKLKRQGWTKPNAFHICITSYKLVLQDHQAFRRKNWKYLILDEAQNIKNFKSQRWQSLLNFNSQRRLLLTGTPLQNSLMELWSLMHFLMPHVFQSHREFKEWFSNPLTGMIEGSQEYNENLVKRLHKVLRPFLLRRVKVDVEKQMPKKYEHVIKCRLSKRQRYLYDDFMAQATTKETLATGHFMSVINILMQLRKVCNHPNLFDPRPIHSPFITEGICFHTASLVLHAFGWDPFKNVDLGIFDLINLEGSVSRYETDTFLPKWKVTRKMIEEIAESPDPPPRPKPVKMKVNRMLQPMPKPENRTVVLVNSPRPTAPLQRPMTPVLPESLAPALAPGAHPGPGLPGPLQPTTLPVSVSLPVPIPMPPSSGTMSVPVPPPARPQTPTLVPTLSQNNPAAALLQSQASVPQVLPMAMTAAQLVPNTPRPLLSPPPVSPTTTTTSSLKAAPVPLPVGQQPPVSSLSGAAVRQQPPANALSITSVQPQPPISPLGISPMAQQPPTNPQSINTLSISPLNTLGVSPVGGQQPPLTNPLGPGPAAAAAQQSTSAIGGMVKPMNIHSAVPTLPGYNFGAAAGGVQQRLLLSPDMQARLPSGEVVSIGQLASLANRPLQGAPGSKPLTFQIQGNKLTLTGTQVRQVTMPQPARQLPRNVVHLVSAGGQHHIISQPAQVALIQAMAQQAGQNPVSVQNVPGHQPPTILPVPATSTTVPPVASTATISVPIAVTQVPSSAVNSSGVVKIVVRQAPRDGLVSPSPGPQHPPMRPVTPTTASTLPGLPTALLAQRATLPVNPVSSVRLPNQPLVPLRPPAPAPLQTLVRPTLRMVHASNPNLEQQLVPPSPPPTVASFAISPASTVTVSANTSPTMVSQIASSPMPKEEPEMLTLRSTTPTPPPPLSILAPRPRRQPPPPPRSPFFLEALDEKRKKQKEERLDRLFRLNEQHCNLVPIYGTEVLRFCTLFPPALPPPREKEEEEEKEEAIVEPSEEEQAMATQKVEPKGSRGSGYTHCYTAQVQRSAQHLEAYWQRSETLAQAILTPKQRIEELTDIIERFIFVMPPVEAPAITMHTSHPPPTLLLQQSVFKETLRQELSPHASCLHRIICNMRTQFPDLRLIQYDCGKLQTLDVLLRQLKAGSHRVLIFTQMTRMLDVLEQFLNYHGHIYLRLDGSTRVEQRQALMERFNADKRIFCFILSTRSGGVGVNLTGADTVVFYDSDWNPTMDAQAQDRCHRIGQTRDVHIYRLISERTVEENILKKANQKRMLGDMAIEGGNFTTAYFKQQTIRELFDMPLDEPTKREGEIPVPVQEEEEDPMATKQTQILEQALCKAEDPEDIRAATQAKAEQVAELAEFNENIPLDAEDRSSKEEEEEISKAEQEIASLVEQLTPIERYAMNFLEASLEDVSREELKQAEEQVEAARKDIDQAKDEVVFKLPEDEDESYLLEEGSSKKNKKAKIPNRTGSERTGTRMSERLRSTRLPPKDGDGGDVECSQSRLPNLRHSRMVTDEEDDNLPQVAQHTRSASVRRELVREEKRAQIVPNTRRTLTRREELWNKAPTSGEKMQKMPPHRSEASGDRFLRANLHRTDTPSAVDKWLQAAPQKSDPGVAGDRILRGTTSKTETLVVDERLPGSVPQASDTNLDKGPRLGPQKPEKTSGPDKLTCSSPKSEVSRMEVKAPEFHLKGLDGEAFKLKVDVEEQETEEISQFGPPTLDFHPVESAMDKEVPAFQEQDTLVTGKLLGTQTLPDGGKLNIPGSKTTPVPLGTVKLTTESKSEATDEINLPVMEQKMSGQKPTEGADVSTSNNAAEGEPVNSADEATRQISPRETTAPPDDAAKVVSEPFSSKSTKDATWETAGSAASFMLDSEAPKMDPPVFTSLDHSPATSSLLQLETLTCIKEQNGLKDSLRSGDLPSRFSSLLTEPQLEILPLGGASPISQTADYKVNSLDETIAQNQGAIGKNNHGEESQETRLTAVCPSSASSQESSSLQGNLSSDDSLSPNKLPRRRTSADVQIQQSCQTSDGPAAKVLRKLPGRLVTVVEEKELIRRRRNRTCKLDSTPSAVMNPGSTPAQSLSEPEMPPSAKALPLLRDLPARRRIELESRAAAKEKDDGSKGELPSNTSSEPVKRKRGRPPKNKSPDQQSPGLLHPFPEPALEISPSQRKAPVRKAPEGHAGTPPSPEQKAPESSTPKSESPKSKTDSSENGDSPVEKRRRGRPPKTRQSPVMPPKSPASEVLLSPSTKPQTVELPTKVQKKLQRSPEAVSVTEGPLKLHKPLDLHPKVAISKISPKARNQTSPHSQLGSDSNTALKGRELTSSTKALSKPSTEACEPRASSPRGASAAEVSSETQDPPYLSPVSRSLPKGAPSSPAANSPPKRKRGRPPKNPSSPRVEVAQPPASNSDQETSLEKQTPAPPGRKRRRRRRKDDLGPSLPSANQSSSDGEDTRPLTRLALLKREEKPESCSEALVQPSPKHTGTERASSAESSTWEQPSGDTPARSTRLRPGCLVPPLERETQRRKRRCSVEGKQARNSSKSPASQGISEQEGGESESSLRSSSESNSYKCIQQPKRQCYDSARGHGRKRGQGHQSGTADRILRSAAKPAENTRLGSSPIPPRKTGPAFAPSAAGPPGGLSSPTTPSSTAPVTSSQSNRGRKPKT